VRFTDGSGGFVEVPFARSGSRRVGFDRELFRGPFGSAWRVAGDGRARRLSLDVSVELPEFPVGGLLLEDGFSLLLEDGSRLLFSEFNDVDEFLSLVDASNFVETPFYSARLAARTRTAVVPTVQGFRVDMSFLLRDEPAYAYVIESEAGVSLSAEDGRLLEVSV